MLPYSFGNFNNRELIAHDIVLDILHVSSEKLGFKLSLCVAIKMQCKSYLKYSYVTFN